MVLDSIAYNNLFCNYSNEIRILDAPENHRVQKIWKYEKVLCPLGKIIDQLMEALDDVEEEGDIHKSRQHLVTFLSHFDDNN